MHLLLHPKNTCKRVFIVSNGVVIQDAVAPATIPPVACTNAIVPGLGGAFSGSVTRPKSLHKQTDNIFIKRFTK